MSDITAFHDAVHDLLRAVTAKVILPRYRTLQSCEIEDKGGGDPVTIADRESEAMLAEGLEKIIPGLAIIGEEAVHADPSIGEGLKGDCWIVDPLDGTRNFASGKPPFGILLAMASGGEAHTGWIYDCLTDRFCVAHKGRGAFVNGERTVAQGSNETVPVAAISMIFMNEYRRRGIMAEIAPHYRLVDIPYCAAEQYPRLALGINDVSIFERTLAWDHAAGALWLNEAGGKVARPDGSAYRVDAGPFGGLIGAASPRLWEDLAARMSGLT